ncbi:VWA domain-containing protein [bacterium]|nr:VWA domain-containing protein [bacterium]
MKKMNLFNPMALREKYSSKNLNKTNNFSSFWLDDNWGETNEVEKKRGVDLIALASYRRAIGNFVNIVTGKDIKVTFTSKGDSFTDGKKVTISSKLDDKLFDSTVGLALHEGSHILLTDFDFLKNLEYNIPKEYLDRAFTKGYSEMESKVHVKNLLNFVEDRRIDFHIFSNSPGYKGYYHSLYEKYFRAKVVDKALLSDEMTDENWDSYIFRIINFTNSNTRLDSLNGLMDIWKVIDLKNISRLNSTEDSLNVALEMYHIILNNIPDGIENLNEETGEVSYEKADGSGSTTDGNSEGGDDESREMTDDEFEDLLDAVENGDVEFSEEESENSVSVPMDSDEESDESSSSEDGDESSSSEDGDESSSSESESGTKKSEVTLTDSQKKSLETAIKKQKKFMDGDIQKKKVSKKDKASIDAVENSGMSYKEVGNDLKDNWTDEKVTKKTKCIVVKKLTKQLIDSETINMLGGRYYSDRNEESITEGLRLGTILGKKLQVRTESRETKYTRKDTGRIDKRLISELGFGNDSVFSQTFIDSFPDAFLHISIDASGSMSGSKWDKTMKSVTSMVKAIDMIEGVDVVVSFRSTQHNHGRGTEDYPIILIAYDSRVDNLIKVKTLWKYIHVAGTTPEGLCYEAVMDEMVAGGNDKESYFLNFSDGMPMFSNGEVNYHYDTAINHTKLMVKKIRERGIKVLSYFIGDGYNDDSYMRDFKRMYGKDSQFVDVTNVTAVAKSMNKRFLIKD